MMFGFDENVPQLKEFWESLAGLVQRISQGCWGWPEHTQAFHNMVRKCHPTKKDVVNKRFHGGKSKAEVAPAGTRFSIELLRSHLMLMWMDRDRFAIPLEQFVCLAGRSTSAERYVGISDACHSRAAVGIYQKDPISSRTELVAWISVKFGYVYPLGYKHQNYVGLYSNTC